MALACARPRYRRMKEAGGSAVRAKRPRWVWAGWVGFVMVVMRVRGLMRGVWERGIRGQVDGELGVWVSWGRRGRAEGV
jgi:hypothetical protein